jgi:hypothetical protein
MESDRLEGEDANRTELKITRLERSSAYRTVQCFQFVLSNPAILIHIIVYVQLIRVKVAVTIVTPVTMAQIGYHCCRISELALVSHVSTSQIHAFTTL